MRSAFVPPKFVAPREASVASYTATPITAADAVEDWLVLQANPDAIVQQRGGSSTKTEWPYVCTLEEDFKDLAWLEICAKNNQLFSYVLRQSDGVYAGCVYIYPIQLFYPELAERYDVDFSFWITQSEYDAGKYAPTFQALIGWFVAGWPFAKDRIYLRNAELPDGIADRDAEG